MNRIEKQLVENKNNNIKSLIAYLVAGDPSMDDTLSLMHGFVDAGVDPVVRMVVVLVFTRTCRRRQVVLKIENYAFSYVNQKNILIS